MFTDSSSRAIIIVTAVIIFLFGISAINNVTSNALVGEAFAIRSIFPANVVYAPGYKNSLNPCKLGTEIYKSDIEQRPYTISSSGYYCLAEDIQVDSSIRPTQTNINDAILIDADGVVLDLNGHKIEKLGNREGTAINQIKSTVRDIQIKNGEIRNFAVGFDFFSLGCKDVSISDITTIGTSRMLFERCNNLVFTDNEFNFPFNLVFGSPVAGDLYITESENLRIEDNIFESENQTQLSQTSRGLSLNRINNGLIENNLFLMGRSDGTAILAVRSEDLVLTRNRIINTATGFRTSLTKKTTISRNLFDFNAPYNSVVAIIDMDASELLVVDNEIQNYQHGVFFRKSEGRVEGNFGCNITIPETYITPHNMVGVNSFNNC